MIRRLGFLGPFALALGMGPCVSDALWAQSSNPYPYWSSAPESYRWSTVPTLPSLISPGSVSQAAQGGSAFGPSYGSGGLGAGVGGGYPVPLFLRTDLSPWQPGSGYSAGLDNKKAHIWLRVPADAEVWVDGVRTRQTGESRYFFSTPLTPGEKYSYNIRVVTKKDGKPVEQKRRVPVHAGATVRLDFAQ
jgi:uncharacterized protein (TIGR03000 family)